MSDPSSQVHNVLKRLRSHNLQISLIDQRGGGGSMHIFYFQTTLSPRVFFLHSIGDLLSRVDNNTIWVYIRQLSVPFLLCTLGPKVKLARIVYMPQCQCVQILFNFPFNFLISFLIVVSLEYFSSILPKISFGAVAGVSTQPKSTWFAKFKSEKIAKKLNQSKVLKFALNWL